MLETSKTTILTGSSMITSEDGDKTRIVHMSANISDDGNINFSKMIDNKSLYLANKEICDADIEEFENAAFNL